jgi:hypothetical protein
VLRHSSNGHLASILAALHSDEQRIDVGVDRLPHVIEGLKRAEAILSKIDVRLELVSDARRRRRRLGPRHVDGTISQATLGDAVRGHTAA